MPRAMFGWIWSDGTYRDAPEPRERPATTEPKPKKPWKPTGFFKDGPDAPRQAALIRNSQAYLYRAWLQCTFTKPTPARIVIEQAKRQGFSIWGLRRARIRLGVKTARAGGKGTGRRNPWIWLFPVAN